MLLEAGDEELPELVVAVRITHRSVSAVEPADMDYFSGLRALDLADNRVRAGSVVFPSRFSVFSEQVL
jgi:hypothetical protein